MPLESKFVVGRPGVFGCRLMCGGLISFSNGFALCEIDWLSVDGLCLVDDLCLSD